MNYRTVLVGTLQGLAAAILVDIHAWSATPDVKFDFNLAGRRWLLGAATGFFTALGLSQVS